MHRTMYDMKWMKVCMLIVFITCLACKSFAQEESMPDSVSTIVEAPTETTSAPVIENNFDSFPGYVKPVVVRNVSDSVLNDLRKDDDYWYANYAPPKKEEKKPETY